MRRPGTTDLSPSRLVRLRGIRLPTLRANGTGIQKDKVPLQSVRIAPSEHTLLHEISALRRRIFMRWPGYHLQLSQPSGQPYRRSRARLPADSGWLRATPRERVLAYRLPVTASPYGLFWLLGGAVLTDSRDRRRDWPGGQASGLAFLGAWTFTLRREPSGLGGQGRGRNGRSLRWSRCQTAVFPAAGRRRQHGQPR